MDWHLVLALIFTAIPTYGYAIYVALKYKDSLLLVDARLLGLLALSGLLGATAVTIQVPYETLTIVALFTRIFVLLIAITARPIRRIE